MVIIISQHEKREQHIQFEQEELDKRNKDISSYESSEARDRARLLNLFLHTLNNYNINIYNDDSQFMRSCSNILSGFDISKVKEAI